MHGVLVPCLQIQECGAVLLRALNEHQTKMQRHIDAKDEAIFRKCGLAAVEHRLECANQHVTLVRQLRDLHVAEQTFAYKEALKRELDVEIQDAKEHPAAPMRSKEALRRLIEDHKATALKLKSKMGFMSNRIMETAGSPDEVKVDGAIDLTRSDNGSGGVEKRAEDGAPNGDGGAGGSGSTRDEMVAVEEGFVYLDGQRLFGPLNLVVNRAGIECPVCLNEFTEDIQLWTLCGHAYCVSRIWIAFL